MKKINYTYRYCTVDMIRKAEKETGISYPDCIEGLEYEVLTVKAKDLDDANKKWLEFQKSLGRMFELEEDVEMDIEAENDEDRYIEHGLEQDWDTFYFQAERKTQPIALAWVGSSPLIKMYTDLKVEKPKEGDRVWIGVDAKPMNPKPAIYKKGKFWDASDNKIELFPTHWKYPNVPFVF